MDRLDLGIMRALVVNNGVPPGIPVLRKSLRSIARDLSVDQGTVRSRMKRLQKQGVLRGWYLGVGPGLTGHSVAQVRLEVDPRRDKRSLVNQLLKVEGVERVCIYLGSKLSLVLLYKGESDLNASLKSVAKVVGSDRLFHTEAASRAPDRAVTQTDLAIIGSLQKDPWKPYAALAKELRLSVRTVNRRIAGLSESGAIYMLPDIDLKALQGIVPAELVIQYESADQRNLVNERIMPRIQDELVFSNLSETQGYFALSVVNASRVEQITEWAKQHKGVRGVHAEVLQDVILNPNHYRR